MSQLLPLSKKILLSPYYASYFFFSLAFIDSIFLHGSIKNILPTKITDIFVYYAIFEFPHILASFFMFGDKEYIETFKNILFRNIYVLVFCALCTIIISQNIFYIIYIGYTLYHVVKQQFGIAKLFRLEPSNFLPIFQYIFIGSGIIALSDLSGYLPKLFLTLSVYISLLSICFYFVYEKKNRTNKYLTLYVISFALASILYQQGYVLFGLLSMRIVHDVTAFMFYCTHNYNRKNYGHNPLFTSWITNKINPIITTVFLAITLNVLYLYIIRLTTHSNFHVVFISIYFGIAMIHYNIESVVWKRDSIARKYITIT